MKSKLGRLHRAVALLRLDLFHLVYIHCPNCAALIIINSRRIVPCRASWMWSCSKENPTVCVAL